MSEKDASLYYGLDLMKQIFSCKEFDTDSDGRPLDSLPRLRDKANDMMCESYEACSGGLQWYLNEPPSACCSCNSNRDRC